MAVRPIVALACALLWQGASVWAQDTIPRPEFGVEYIAEGQTDMHGATKAVMYLHLAASLPMDRFAYFDVATISVISTNVEPLVDDLQGFSNVDAENVPVRLAVLGLRFPIREKHTLFVGIRNINEDYFTSDVTAFYTNSSCGVFPTISANCDIANYPYAAPCVHYRYESDHWGLNASAYHNGYLITQTEYHYLPETTFAGSLYGGACADFTPATVKETGCPQGTLWAYLEQSLSSRLSLIAGYSHAFGRELECTDFAGLGLHFRLKNTELGFFSDYARMTDASEFATELTAKFSFAHYCYLQPSIHMIATDGRFQSVCALRFGLRGFL